MRPEEKKRMWEGYELCEEEMGIKNEMGERRGMYVCGGREVKRKEGGYVGGGKEKRNEEVW